MIVAVGIGAAGIASNGGERSSMCGETRVMVMSVMSVVWIVSARTVYNAGIFLNQRQRAQPLRCFGRKNVKGKKKMKNVFKDTDNAAVLFKAWAGGSLY